jgi:hypothetical protein
VFLIALPSLRRAGMMARCNDETKVVCKPLARKSVSVK